MLIGVMSDTHLERVTGGLQRILESHFQKADLILHAGDIVSGAVLSYLDGWGVSSVRGNMDRPEVSGVLPVKRVIQAGPFKIGLIHGFGAPRGLAEKLINEFDEIDCLVFGHSHQAANRVAGGVLCFNPGSAAESLTGRRRTIGLLHVTDRIEGEIVHID